MWFFVHIIFSPQLARARGVSGLQKMSMVLWLFGICDLPGHHFRIWTQEWLVTSWVETLQTFDQRLEKKRDWCQGSFALLQCVHIKPFIYITFIDEVKRGDIRTYYSQSDRCSYLAVMGGLIPLLLNFCDPEFPDSSTSSIGSSSSMLLSTVVSSFGIFDPSPYFLRKYATLLVKSVGTSSPPGAQSEGRACDRSDAFFYASKV